MNLELYPLRVFCAVMDHGTFSAAAEAMRISQPTVSQQVARLEGVLNSRLFQRVGHKVVPTPAAEKVWVFARELLGRVEEFEESLADDRSGLRGLVRYGMPESCQWTPHYRRIMQQIAEFPALDFQVSIQPGDLVVERLLRGELDFGFVIGDRESPDLRYEKFGDEEYCLVSARKEFFAGVEERGGTARWIRFPGSDLFFDPWRRAHHYKPNASRDRVVLQIGTLAGAIHAVEEGAGMAVVPRQCVSESLDRGRLRAWAKGRAASQPIYVARRGGEPLPKRCELVLDLLKKAKRDLE